MIKSGLALVLAMLIFYSPSQADQKTTEDKLPIKVSCKKAWSTLIEDDGQHLYNYETDKKILNGFGNVGYESYLKRLASSGVERQDCEKEWTVLIFMSPSDLLEYSYIDLYEMELGYKDRVRAGSTIRNDILVHFSPDHLDEARRYHIMQVPEYKYNLVKDFTGIEDCKIDEVANLKEECGLTVNDLKKRSETDIQSPIVNMVDKDVSAAQSFEDFLRWGIENYPSQNYLVIVWGHGQGWTAFDPNTGEIGTTKRYGGLAFSEQGFLSIPQLANALKKVKEGPLMGRNIDIYASDACLMQMAEVSYEISEYTNFIVGSANLQNPFGLPYRTFFRDLNELPLTTKASELEMRALIPHLTVIEDNLAEVISKKTPADRLLHSKAIILALEALAEESKIIFIANANIEAERFIADNSRALFPQNPSSEEIERISMRVRDQIIENADIPQVDKSLESAKRYLQKLVYRQDDSNLDYLKRQFNWRRRQITADRIPKQRQKKVQEVSDLILKHQRGSLLTGYQSKLDPSAKKEFTMTSLSGNALHLRLMDEVYKFSVAMREFIYTLDFDGRMDLQTLIIKTPGFVGASKDFNVFLARIEEHIRKRSEGRFYTDEEKSLLLATLDLMRSLSEGDESVVLGNVQGLDIFRKHYNALIADDAFDLALDNFAGLAVWLPESEAEFISRIEDMRHSKFYMFGQTEYFEYGPWGTWLQLIFATNKACQDFEEPFFVDFFLKQHSLPPVSKFSKHVSEKTGKAYLESHVAYCLGFYKAQVGQ